MDEMDLWMSGEALWVKNFYRILATYIIIGRGYLGQALRAFELKTAGRQPYLNALRNRSYLPTVYQLNLGRFFQ